MKLTKEQIVRAALRLLDEVGLEAMTLRKIATELGVQAPALYWHLKNREQLLDEMASTILIDASAKLDPEAPFGAWQEEVRTAADFLRTMMLTYRDGAKLISGTYFTGDELAMAPERRQIPVLRKAGMTTLQATDLMMTVLHYVTGFVIEEQEIFPYPGQRDPRYEVENLRAAKAKAEHEPGTLETYFAGTIEERFHAGIDFIIGGAERLIGRG